MNITAILIAWPLIAGVTAFVTLLLWADTFPPELARKRRPVAARMTLQAVLLGPFVLPWFFIMLLRVLWRMGRGV